MKIRTVETIKIDYEATCDCGKQARIFNMIGQWDPKWWTLDVDCDYCYRCRTYVGPDLIRLRLTVDLPSSRFSKKEDEANAALINDLLRSKK